MATFGNTPGYRPEQPDLVPHLTSVWVEGWIRDTQSLFQPEQV